MNKAWRHLRTIQHHRRLVRQHCFQIGLYRQGLMHDLSKYSPVEFRVGAKYFQGTQSPNNIERREKGYSSAWLHHKAAINTIWNTGLITMSTATTKCAA